MSGQPGTMRVGNISVSRDFSDVRDVVRAYRLLVESDYAGEVFNVGAGKSYSLSSILETIISFSEQSITVEVDPALLQPSWIIRLSAPIAARLSACWDGFPSIQSNRVCVPCLTRLEAICD